MRHSQEDAVRRLHLRLELLRLAGDGSIARNPLPLLDADAPERHRATAQDGRPDGTSVKAQP